MKKIFCILAGAVLFTGCAKEQSPAPDSLPVEVRVGADVRSRLDGEPAVKTGEEAAVDWTAYDIRYMLEVWTTGAVPERVLRLSEVRDNLSTPVAFTLRLLPLNYDFLFWADIVPQSGGGADFHYGTETEKGLREVAVLSGKPGKNFDYRACDPTRDAFAAVRRNVSVEQGFTLEAMLKRPFARLVLKNKDDALFPVGTAVRVSFGNLPTRYDVSEDKVSEFRDDWTVDFPVTENSSVAGWDYLFVPGAGQAVSMTAAVGNVEKKLDELPLEPNRQTIVSAAWTNP